MLRTRVITGAVLAVLAFAVLFAAPPAGFRAAFAALFLVGCWEYARLASLGPVARGLLFAVQVALFFWLFRYWSGVSGHALAFLVAGSLSWCLMFLRLVTWQPGSVAGLNYRLLSAFTALASLFFATFALFWLRDSAGGAYMVLLLFLIIWCADIGAYFSGRAFGRKRLAPAISPGKTREGLFGGVVLSIVVALAFAEVAPLPSLDRAGLALVTLVTALASAGGDLLISIHKRTVGLKDSGKLFPGHGGVLDRFDSLLAGAPFFALGVLWLTHGAA